MPNETTFDKTALLDDDDLPARLADDPNILLAWDSVSTNCLQDCAWKFKLQIIEGWVPKKMAPPLSFGILFHSCAEFYEKKKAEGLPFHEALRESVRYAFVKSWGFVGDGDNETGAVRTRFTLIRALIWYADKYRDDHFETLILANGKPAAELSFRIALPLMSPLGSPYIYCGHIDRVGKVRGGGETLIGDYKTSKTTISPSWFRKFDSAWQMTGYTFAGQLLLADPPTGVLIEGVQLAVGFTRFGRGKTERSQDMIDEWLEDFLYWIKLAEKFAADEHWPMNRQHCDMYGGCVFKKICDMAPSARAEWLRADFKQEPWNPLINRGD